MRSSDWISDVGSSDLLDLAKQSHGQSESHPDSLGQGKKSQGFQKDSKSDSEAPKFAFWTRFCALTHDPRPPSSIHPRPPSRRPRAARDASRLASRVGATARPRTRAWAEGPPRPPPPPPPPPPAP